MKSGTIVIARPQAGEYAPYYDKYVALVANGEILTTLEKQSRETAALLSDRKDAEGDLRYAPGKWSVKEVLGHVTDAERVFAYRALRIARNDQTPMEGFEQDDYVRYGAFRPVHPGGFGGGVRFRPQRDPDPVPRIGRSCLDAPGRGQQE